MESREPPVTRYAAAKGYAVLGHDMGRDIIKSFLILPGMVRSNLVPERGHEDDG